MNRLLATLFFTVIGSAFFFGVHLHANTQVGSAVSLVLSGICFWLGAIHGINDQKDRFPRFLHPAIRWLHAMSFELFIALFAHFVLRPFLHVFGRKEKMGKGTVPVLLVHGYLCDWTSLIYLQKQLVKEGFGPVYLVDLGHIFGSLTDYVQEVTEMAGVIKQETKCSELILIGHSMGGLVAYAYAAQAPIGRVKAVISIGSPLSGTWAARLGVIGKSGREMLPGSDTIRKIQQGVSQKNDVGFYQVMSRTDELIFPAESALGNTTPDHQFVVDDIGHMALLFSRRVLKKIVFWLDKNV